MKNYKVISRIILKCIFEKWDVVLQTTSEQGKWRAIILAVLNLSYCCLHLTGCCLGLMFDPKDHGTMVKLVKFYQTTWHIPEGNTFLSFDLLINCCTFTDSFKLT